MEAFYYYVVNINLVIEKKTHEKKPNRFLEARTYTEPIGSMDSIFNLDTEKHVIQLAHAQYVSQREASEHINSFMETMKNTCQIHFEKEAPYGSNTENYTGCIPTYNTEITSLKYEVTLTHNGVETYENFDEFKTEKKKCKKNFLAG